MRWSSMVVWVVFSLVMMVCVARSDEALSLLDPQDDSLGWTADNGQEFPGAVVSLSVDKSDKPCLRLEGDFSKGGGYVQASRGLTDTDISEISFTLKYPDAETLTLRLGDGSGQCHQISLKLKRSPDWQNVRFPVAEFLSGKGGSVAAESVAKYENWGGANDGKWHAPCKYVALLVTPGTPRDRKVVLSLSDIKVQTREKSATMRKMIRLDDFTEGEVDWDFSNGQEFEGASGSLGLVNDAAGTSVLKLDGDFTKGGAYVGMGKNLEGLNITSVKFRMKSVNATRFGIQFKDSTGQVHQNSHNRIQNDGQWHTYTLKPTEVAGGEHWGGANDGQWHAPADMMFLSIMADSAADKKPVIEIADIVAEALVEAIVQPASYQVSFEGLMAVPSAWKQQGPGRITLDKGAAFKGDTSLGIVRTQTQMDQGMSLVLDPFPVKEGVWELNAALNSSLYSPDSSYNGMIRLEVFDAAGRRIEDVEVALITGSTPWKVFKKRIELASGASSARIVVQVNKTHGRLGVDELTASYVSPSARANASVTAIKFSSEVLGNLFMPGDKIRFDVTAECKKPLPETARAVVCVLKDYWGAELAPPFRIKLEKTPGPGKVKAYKGTLDLGSVKLEEGKYYELHGEVAEPGIAEPFRDRSSFAILPLAVTKQYKPFDIPFTSRDWDNRIREYFYLSDRIGVRVCGVWSGWSTTPPYEPYAPGIEHCKALGMGALLGTPGNQIEYRNEGYQAYTETVLREGAKNMVNKYRDYVPIVVSLGNEPHAADDDRAKEMIAAYKAMYEGVKQADPNITVIGSSSGPEEIYFKNGFQPYQDVYDFHVYEDSSCLKGAFQSYARLFAKYGHRKPIWSTEIGLNSQGMTRRAITIDLIKKFSIFFAEGGANFSWFDLLYPDPEGKAEGSNGDSFNVFNSKYCLYSPRLDAVAYYNMVNAICIKKFIETREYEGGVAATLFRDKDAKCLLVLWKGKGRQESFVPLAGVGKVRVIRIDGSSASLDAAGKGLTLSLSEEPLLLLFESPAMKLASHLGGPKLAVQGDLPQVIKGGVTRLVLTCNGLSPDEVSLSVPPFWGVKQVQAGGSSVVFELSAPEATGAREGRVVAQFKGRGGELYLALPISGKLSLDFVPVPMKTGVAGMTFTVRNNASESVDVQWSLKASVEYPMTAGTFKLGEPVGFQAAFTTPTEGKLTVGGKTSREVTVLASNFNPLNLYDARLEVTDVVAGKRLVQERPFGGFAAVPRAKKAVKFDGKLGDPAWQSAPVLTIDDPRQYFMIFAGPSTWKGTGDLSAKLRYLWDDQYLYIGIDVTDDVFCNPKEDGDIWNGDGIQIIVDPCRDLAEKPGRYDYVFAKGRRGPQTWCATTADAIAPVGEVKDVVLKVTPTGTQGGMVYEIAIPWTRLAPFKPGPGRTLGMGLILNEDDGPGRTTFMGWFGCAHSKQLGMNGDLILTP